MSRNNFSFLLFTIVGLICLLNSVEFSLEVNKAHCTLRGTEKAPSIRGEVEFTEAGNGNINVSWSIDEDSVPDEYSTGEHGFHVHQYGITTEDGAGAGGHYEGGSETHALPFERIPSEHHAGDLGNINFNETFSGTKESSRLQFEGDRSIIGRMIILHAKNDKGVDEQPSGAAGSRIAQCVIGIANTVNENVAKQNMLDSGAAFAYINATEKTDSNVYGKVLLTATEDAGVRVQAKICGLEPNSEHGFHIHYYGQLNYDDGTDAGGHYNPHEEDHALPSQTDSRHVGDLGNLEVDGNGFASFDESFSLVELEGDDSVYGRAFVIHEESDKGEDEQPSGGAGSRIAIGNIGVASESSEHFNLEVDCESSAFSFVQQQGVITIARTLFTCLVVLYFTLF